MNALVFIVLAVWLLASLANQISGPWTRRLSVSNNFSLLPILFFFAPDPIDVDYHLLFRDYLDDGSAGPWRQIPSDRDGPLRMLWSTTKRDRQASLTAVGGIALLQQAVTSLPASEEVIQISLPYLYLLNRVRQEPRPPGARERQFMVVETTGFGVSRPVALAILSNPHRLD